MKQTQMVSCTIGLLSKDVWANGLSNNIKVYIQKLSLDKKKNYVVQKETINHQNNSNTIIGKVKYIHSKYKSRSTSYQRSQT